MVMMMMRKLFSLSLWCSLVLVCVGEVWEKDMSEDIYIEASHEGFTSVELSCGRKSMVVQVNMEEDFDGVIYTRGSFMTKYERGKGEIDISDYSLLQVQVLFSRC